MMGTGALNSAALSLALCASALLVNYFDRRDESTPLQAPALATMLETVDLPGSRRGLRDARGEVVPLIRYQRIISGSTVADHVLWEICERERVVAFTTHSRNNPMFGHRYIGTEALDGLADLERVLALSPDLIITNRFADPRRIARLRERGIAVFDLGEMHGLSTLLPSIRAVGLLVDAPTRAARLADSLALRMAALAAAVPETARKEGIYLSIYGSRIYGGGRETSYDDVMRHAGVVNLAASHFAGWPSLDPEQVLALDPQVVLTKTGMGPLVCDYPGLSEIRACLPGGQIIEIDPLLLDDPGPPLLEATEALFKALHGTLPHP